MNKKNLVLIASALVVLILGSTLIYKALTKNYDENAADSMNQIKVTPEVSQEAEESNSLTNKDQHGAVSVTDAPEITSDAEITVVLDPTKAPEITVTPDITTSPDATPVPTVAAILTESPAATNTAADFTVETYSGSSISLSDYFGKPIVLNFWASWCGPCKSEMPAFNTVYNDYKNDVVFFMVDLVDGSRETKSSGYNYVTGQGFNFPVYYDTKQDAAYQYSVTSVPTTYFIDTNGNVVSIQKGAMSETKLRNQIESILN